MSVLKMSVQFADGPNKKKFFQLNDLSSSNQFSPATLNNDIAILQLSKPVKTNPIIQKVCLPTPEMLRTVSKNLEKLDCVVIGHGKLNESKWPLNHRHPLESLKSNL